MSNVKQLEELLTNDVLKEINENIKELSEIANKKKNKASKEELDYMKDVKKYFDDVLADIKNNTLTEEQAIDILEGLEDMRVENQEV